MIPQSTSTIIPSNPETLASEISEFLKSLQNQPTTYSVPYIHPLPISFEHQSHKNNWFYYLPDGDHRDTIQRFCQAKTQTTNIRLGLFSMPTSSWVGQKQESWDKAPWHCWGCALIRHKESGYIIILWDCDPKPVNERRSSEDLLQCGQRTLVRVLKKRFAIREIWINIDRQFSGFDKCLHFTLRWIKFMAQYGNQ